MMIRRWIRDGPAEATAVPCWMTLVHAVDAPYGGHSPALAKILAEAHPALGNGVCKHVEICVCR